MPILENFELYCQSLKLLAKQKNWKAVLRTVQKALAQSKALHHYQALGTVLAQVPLNVLAESPDVALWFQVLEFGKNAKTLLALYSSLPEHERQRYADVAAWAYWHKRQVKWAEALLEQQDSGLAWRLRGQLSVGKAGWQGCFEAAIERLQGRALGICYMEFGDALFAMQDLSRARSQYTLACHILKHDRYYSARIRCKLGLVALELGLTEAETHFLVARQQSQHPEASCFAARAWAGLGAVWRSYGEYDRAAYAYQRAIQKKPEPDDHIDLLCGLAQTWRCTGELNKALEALHEALGGSSGTKTTKIHVLLAATHLQNGEVAQAQPWLKNLEQPKGETALRLTVLQAEQKRLAGEVRAARALLEQLPLERGCIQEEQRCFASLFQVKTVQIPLKKIEVRALGALEVRVNGRLLWLEPTSRAAELLVYLLEHAGQASSEAICHAFYPRATQVRNTEKTLWRIAQQLRDAFAWDSSIKNVGKAYVLDHCILQYYDARNATDKSRLLEGVHSDWLRRVRRA
ncbi:MAG: tetratricopeptide repeat protein [Deinococcales bacterium]